MRLKRSRLAVLGAAVIVVTLTACAPPGQDGDPGVAATYEGTDVTNAEVNVTYQAWLNDTKGADVANRRQIITIQLLQNDLLAKCKELGYPVTWATAQSYANQWIQFKGVSGHRERRNDHCDPRHPRAVRRGQRRSHARGPQGDF